MKKGAVNEVPKPVVKKNDLFKQLKANEGQDMDIEDIIAMMQKIGVDTSDPLGGYLNYIMKVQNGHKITKQEFQRLTTYLGANNLDDIKSKVPLLRKEFQEKAVFAKVYEYLFDLYKEQLDSKTIPFETAEQIWIVYLKGRFTLYDEFVKYVGGLQQKKPINKDTWKMVNSFGSTIKQDLQNYSENDGWPVFLDNFVNHIRGV